MTPKGHAIPSKTQLLSYGTPAFGGGRFFWKERYVSLREKALTFKAAFFIIFA